jgi:CRP-like cAMP-binding protein
VGFFQCATILGVPDPRTRVISAIELFSELGPEEAEYLACCTIQRKYGAGEVLFLEGEPCAGLHIIAQGAVKVVKTTPSGRQLVVMVERAPSTVAEVPVFDGGPYPATVMALVETTTLLVLRDDFRAFCKRNPELGLRFLEVFGKRLRHLLSLVESITFGNVRQRLAGMLIEFRQSQGSDLIQLPESHEQLAGRLGTVREVVTRNLSRFQSEGLIRIQRREIEIVDPEGLHAEAETEL